MSSYMPTYGAKALSTGGASGGAGIVVGTDTFKLSLNTGTVPTANRDNATEYYGGSDFASEASGTNYTAGGNTIAIAASQPAIYTTGSVHYASVAASASSTSWSTVTLASVTYAVLYDNTSSTKWAIAVYDFGGAQSVTANTFTINWTTGYPSEHPLVFELQLMPQHVVPCAVCDGRHTVDSLLELRLNTPPGQVRYPLCWAHYQACENAVYEMRNIKSPPVVINVAAVGNGG